MKRKEHNSNWKRVFTFVIAVTLIFAISINALAETIYYIVKPGDSLSKIATSHKVDVDALAAANGIKDKNTIYPGQKLIISETPPEEGVKTDMDDGVKEQEQPGELDEYVLEDSEEAPDISITMLDSSVSDILSAIAINLDEYIFYIGKDENVTFIVDQVKPKKALELFIKAVQPSGQRLSYIKDGNILIVGPLDLLRNNFFNQITLTKFKLKYIPAEVLSAQISALGINTSSIYLDTAVNYLFVQGTPYELAKVAELISVLDKKEYFPEDSGPGVIDTKIVLKQYDLKYISAEMLKSIVSGLQIKIDMVTVAHNEKSIWINGDSKAIADFEEVKNKMDIAKNAPAAGNAAQESEYRLYQYNFSYIIYDDIADILDALLPEITIMPLKLYPRVVLLYGKPENFKSFLSLVDGLDQRYLADKTKFFFHQLQNITADYAAERLQSLGLNNVSVNVLSVSKFGRDLLVICPEYMHEDVKNILWSLDTKGTVIRVPVDYSDVIDGQSKLEKRRDLLVTLTGLFKEQFHISGNVSRGDSYHYIMYVEGTPEEIQLVSDMIQKIDNPA